MRNPSPPLPPPRYNFLDQPPRSITLPDLSAILSTILFTLILLYLLLANTSFPSVLMDTLGLNDGGTKERIELLFGGSNPAEGGIVARFRARLAGVFFGDGTGLGGGDGDGDEHGDGVVGGLWNMGNTCYQNSVIQAMASLDYLKLHLSAVANPVPAGEEDDDVWNGNDGDDGDWQGTGQGAIGALASLLESLNRSRRTFYVPPVIRGSGPGGSGWMYNEQQDAQEFFQKLTGVVEREVGRFWVRRKPKVAGLEAVGVLWGSDGVADGAEKSGKGDQDEYGENQGMGKATGLRLGGRLMQTVRGRLMPDELKNPFEGLSAQRVGCLRCGYVEAIRLQPYTSLSLSLPSEYDCTLEECLKEYTLIEQIPSVQCDKCTLLHHRAKLITLLNPREPNPPPPPTLANTLSHRLELTMHALQDDDFSTKTFKRLNLANVPKVTSVKTKQTMLARPPSILVLHLNRSQFDMRSGVTKKNFAKVKVPAWLDIGEVVTGVEGMEVDPSRPISKGLGRGRWGRDGTSGGNDGDDNSEDEDEGRDDPKRKMWYELKGLVAHYGGHHNGHYICYRKTRGKEKGVKWWRISDEKVLRVGVEEVESVGNAFMAFYERMEEGEYVPVQEVGIPGVGMGAELPVGGVTSVCGRGGGQIGLGVRPGIGVGGVGLGMGMGGLGMGMGMGGRVFGSESDVDAVLSGVADGLLKGLVRNDVMHLGANDRGEVGIETQAGKVGRGGAADDNMKGGEKRENEQGDKRVSEGTTATAEKEQVSLLMEKESGGLAAPALTPSSSIPSPTSSQSPIEVESTDKPAQAENGGDHSKTGEESATKTGAEIGSKGRKDVKKKTRKGGKRVRGESPDQEADLNNGEVEKGLDEKQLPSPPESPTSPAPTAEMELVNGVNGLTEGGCVGDGGRNEKLEGNEENGKSMASSTATEVGAVKKRKGKGKKRRVSDGVDEIDVDGNAGSNGNVDRDVYMPNGAVSRDGKV